MKYHRICQTWISPSLEMAFEGTTNPADWRWRFYDRGTSQPYNPPVVQYVHSAVRSGWVKNSELASPLVNPPNDDALPSSELRLDSSPG